MSAGTLRCFLDWSHFTAIVQQWSIIVTMRAKSPQNVSGIHSPDVCYSRPRSSPVKCLSMLLTGVLEPESINYVPKDGLDCHRVPVKYEPSPG